MQAAEVKTTMTHYEPRIVTRAHHLGSLLLPQASQVLFLAAVSSLQVILETGHQNAKFSHSAEHGDVTTTTVERQQVGGISSHVAAPAVNVSRLLLLTCSQHWRCLRSQQEPPANGTFVRDALQ